MQDIETMQMVYVQMKKIGVQPSVVTFTSLLDAYAKNGKVDEAMKLVNDMRKSGIPLKYR